MNILNKLKKKLKLKL